MNWKIFVGSTFYSSFLIKRAPGTSSSLVLFVLFFFLNPVNIFWTIAILVILTFLHFICYPVFVTTHSSEDPPLYTLDEAVSMVLLSIFFNTPIAWLFAFLLFRFFDIFKPLGIRKIETLAGLSKPLRNIGDDLLAAVYTFVSITTYEFFF